MYFDFLMYLYFVQYVDAFMSPHHFRKLDMAHLRIYRLKQTVARLVRLIRNDIRLTKKNNGAKQRAIRKSKLRMKERPEL